MGKVVGDEGGGVSAGAGRCRRSCMVTQGWCPSSSCVRCCVSLSPSPHTSPPSRVSPACVSPPRALPARVSPPCALPACVSPPPHVSLPPRISHPPQMSCLASSLCFVHPCRLFTCRSRCASLSPRWRMFLVCSLLHVVASLAPVLVCLSSCVLVVLSFHVVVGSSLCCVVVVGL